MTARKPKSGGMEFEEFKRWMIVRIYGELIDIEEASYHDKLFKDIWNYFMKDNAPRREGGRE